MNIVSITNDVFFIRDITNVGVIRTIGNSVILIDSGIDAKAGKRILNILQRKNLKVKTIINTHSHPNHCGGNNYIQKKTKAKTFAPEIEAQMIRNPELMSMQLFCGADPIKDFKKKNVMTEKSKINRIIKKNKKELKIDGITLKIIPLPGHTANQIGILYDNVFFCADTIFSERYYDKHKILFLTNINDAIKTLKKIKLTRYNFYVPSHSTPIKVIKKQITLNIQKLEDIKNAILGITMKGKTTEEIYSEVCRFFNISIKSIKQYYIVRTSVMAYLSSFYNLGKIEIVIKENKLLWKNK